MGRKIRPIEEGCLAGIAKYFAPLLALRPDNIGLEDWVNRVIFHTHERIIKTYVARDPFNMPGLYYWLPTMPIQGYSRRAVPIGSRLVVRTDSKRPDVVDVEVCTPVREREARVFRLSPKQFRRIKPWLTEVRPAKAKKK